jgi:Zn-dependent M16 (insulinase) family peptidase
MVQWTHVASVFVKVEAALDTTCLPPALRLCLPLLLESAFKLAVKETDGSVTPADSVIEQLQADTVGFSCSVGIGGGEFSPGSYGSNTVFFKIKAEASAYEKAVLWLRKVLFQTVLDPAILKVQAAKLHSEVPNTKRSTGGELSCPSLHTADVLTGIC